MTQRRTDRLDRSKPTGPLPTGDLGLLATAIVLRGRRVLGKRAPRALAQADKALARPAVRAALNAIATVVERVTTTVDVVKARFTDLLQAVARQTVGRAQGLVANLGRALRARLPGGR